MHGPTKVKYMNSLKFCSPNYHVNSERQVKIKFPENL